MEGAGLAVLRAGAADREDLTRAGAREHAQVHRGPGVHHGHAPEARLGARRAGRRREGAPLPARGREAGRGGLLPRRRLGDWRRRLARQPRARAGGGDGSRGGVGGLPARARAPLPGGLRRFAGGDEGARGAAARRGGGRQRGRQPLGGGRQPLRAGAHLAGGAGAAVPGDGLRGGDGELRAVRGRAPALARDDAVLRPRVRSGRGAARRAGVLSAPRGITEGRGARLRDARRLRRAARRGQGVREAAGCRRRGDAGGRSAWGAARLLQLAGDGGSAGGDGATGAVARTALVVELL